VGLGVDAVAEVLLGIGVTLAGQFPLLLPGNSAFGFEIVHQL
jgi:hypothetical protein